MLPNYIVELVGGSEDGKTYETGARAVAQYTEAGNIYISRPESEDVWVCDGFFKMRMIYKCRGGKKELIQLLEAGEIDND